MKIFRNTNVLGALSAAALLLILTSWLWFPRVFRIYSIWRVTSTFRSNEASYRQRAIDTLLVTRIHHNIAVHRDSVSADNSTYVGELRDGTSIILFCTDDNHSGYLYSGRPLNKHDVDETQMLITKSNLINWLSEPVYVVRTLDTGWYYVEQDSS